jgi:hypothetical protein
MGFNSSATSVTLTAKLTPIGRQKLVSTNNNLIKFFSLGDSDANYYSSLTLSSGQVPSINGEIGFANTISNSTPQFVGIKSFLVVNQNGDLTKPVSPESINILTETANNGSVTISGNNLTYNLVNRNNVNSDPLVNLFGSFNLPLDSTSDINYTGVTAANGGYSDTCFSGFATNKVLFIGINNASYGEVIDGKTVKLVLPTSAGTYTLYSTLQSGNGTVNELDASYRDIANNVVLFGLNVAPLFSDTIKKPNSDASLSWATGYGLDKPFSNNGKRAYSLQTNSNIALTADTAVGMAYLDKGFIAITNPVIIDAITSTGTTLFSGITATTLTFDSISTNVSQIITCIAERGEFGASTSIYFADDDIAKVTEVGLYDDFGNLIAYGKTDRQITKNVNQFLALSIKITI